MKTQVVLVTVALVLLGCSQQGGKPSDGNAHIASIPLPDSEATHEVENTGVAPGVIRAEIGKFILLKREGADVALKIVARNRPNRTTGTEEGARYECFVSGDDNHSYFQKFAGEVYGGPKAGRMDPFIYCGTFAILWFPGDWIYFGDCISAMARTDRTDIKDVNFADPKLHWYPRTKLAHSHGAN